jgi:uncharacterized damage-inducible protein DinB
LDEALWLARPYTSVEAEVEFAKPYRKELLNWIGSYTPGELSTTKVDYSGRGYFRSVGDFILNRVIYHESVHTGQMLSYLRMMCVPRPNIWD